MFEMVVLSIGMFIGMVIGFALSKMFGKPGSEKFVRELNKLRQEKGQFQEQISALKNTYGKMQDEKQQLYGKYVETTNKLSSYETEKKLLMDKIESNSKESGELHQQLLEQFEKLSNKLVEEQREKLGKQNKENLGSLLNPLKDQLKEFHKKVEATHNSEAKERSSLKTQLESLHELNQNLGKETKHLSVILKGDSKTQGHWGEIILETVLKNAGLREGEEYVRESEEVSDNKASKGQHKPSVIIKLPDDKRIIIDSRMSLTGYEKAINAGNELDRKRFEREYVQSVLRHVIELSEKYYHKDAKKNSPDFVLMFLPVESALSVAYQTEKNLFQQAWEKRITIVSPTTLYATMQTIASLWAIEQRNKNAKVITEQSGKLYDKFVLFVSDLEKVGEGLHRARESYDGAMRKLNTEKENLVHGAETLRDLGINKQAVPKESPANESNGEGELVQLSEKGE